jgi:hypothetical protein
MTCRVTCVVRLMLLRSADGLWDPTKLLPGAVPSAIERPVREAGRLPSSSDEIKNGSGYRIPPLSHTTSWHAQDQLHFSILLYVIKSNRWYMAGVN